MWVNLPAAAPKALADSVPPATLMRATKKEPGAGQSEGSRATREQEGDATIEQNCFYWRCQEQEH